MTKINVVESRSPDQQLKHLGVDRSGSRPSALEDPPFRKSHDAAQIGAFDVLDIFDFRASAARLSHS